MRYYRRKAILPILFLFVGVIILFTGILQIIMKNNRFAIYQIGVALLFVYDAYVFNRPYLGLNEGQLTVQNGLSKIVIPLNDITSIDESNKKLFITFNQGAGKMKLRILLSQLKAQDKEQFIIDVKSKVTI